MSGTLWVVATPIGNLDDITLRAIKVLSTVKVVLAEDTRHSRRLLLHHGITTPTSSLHSYTTDGKIGEIVDDLLGGASYAVISDAGTPVVSDPAGKLTVAARDAGVRVSVTPGASAVLAALSIAGLHADRFKFWGFLPRSGRKRHEALAAIATDPAAHVLFDGPSRTRELLSALESAIGTRRVAVCRELTKVHEEAVRGTVSEVLAELDDEVRGEITVVVEASQEVESEEFDAPTFIASRLEAGVHPKQIAKELAAVSELSGADAYALVLQSRMK